MTAAPNGNQQDTSSGTGTGDGRPAPDRCGTIPERLVYVFQTVVQSDGKPYTAGKVATWIVNNGGQISAVYIMKILRGERREPGSSYLKLIARFFEINPTFFYEIDPGPLDGARQNMMILLREPEVASALQRFTSLSPNLRQAVSELIDRMLATETPVAGAGD